MRTKFLIIHHSASAEDTKSEDIDRWHKNRNWGTSTKPVYAEKSSLGYYGQYHFFIDREGHIAQFRDLDEVGWHSGDWETNQRSIAICFAGNFNDLELNNTQKEAFKEVYKWIDKPELEIKMHRDIKATACPGNNITLDIIKSLINNNMRYVIVDKEQYLLDDNLMIAFNIPNIKELEELSERGLDGQPEPIDNIDGYRDYSMNEKDSLRDMFGL